MDSIEETNIQIVMRQTNYTHVEASAHLNLNNHDIPKVIRNYLNNGVPVTAAAAPLSMNQQIYKEIRTLMDEVVVNPQQ
jgi:hypothetical protein